jgi:hypothetical protein
MASDNLITQAHCNLCGHSTHHDIVGIEILEQQRTEGTIDLLWDDSFEMLKCRGCDTVTMRVTKTDPFASRPPTIVYYPPAIARRAPEWMLMSAVGSLEKPVDIPDPIYHLMGEVYVAVQNGLGRLAAMGIRATLENVMKEKIGDCNFKVAIDEFQKGGYLSMRQALSLDSIIEAGHAAVHRGWEPTDDDINTLLDITESIIETVYLHEHRAQELDKRVPRRQRASRRDRSRVIAVAPSRNELAPACDLGTVWV